MDQYWVTSLLNVLRALSKKIFQTFVKTAFWFPSLKGVPKLFLRSHGTLLRCPFLNTFRSLSWNFSADLSKLLSTCPKYLFWEKFSDFARNTSERSAKVFQQGFQTCILQGVQPNNLGKVFFSICSIYCSHLSAKMFLPDSSKLQFMRPEERFGNIFPIRAKIFWSSRKKVLGTPARSSFHVYRGILLQNKLSDFEDKVFGSFQ